MQNGGETGVDCGGADCPFCIPTCDAPGAEGHQTSRTPDALREARAPTPCGGLGMPMRDAAPPSLRVPAGEPRPSALLGIAINQDHTSPFEMVWAFSIYLEAVAILPQLFMLQKQGGAENLTSHYVMLRGLYRLFYLFNWVYRYATEENYMQVIVWVSGIVQTALYLDFFYNYLNAKRESIDAPVVLDDA